jgi:hypothetical protein
MLCFTNLFCSNEKKKIKVSEIDGKDLKEKVFVALRMITPNSSDAINLYIVFVVFIVVDGDGPALLSYLDCFGFQ